MAERKSILLRLQPEAYAALQRWAADEFRSLNGQIEFVLDQSLKQVGRLPRPRPLGAGEPPASEAQPGSSEVQPGSSEVQPGSSEAQPASPGGAGAAGSKGPGQEV